MQIAVAKSYFIKKAEKIIAGSDFNLLKKKEQSFFVKKL